MELVPKEKSIVSRTLSDYSTVIYGVAGIGKSSFGANFPKAYFIDTNSGLGGLAVYKSPVITSWNQIIAIGMKLKTPEFQEFYDTVIIDTIEELYDLCLLYVCEQQGVEHPSDINQGKGDFGKTWKEVIKELNRFLKSLQVWGYGRVLISHVKEYTAPGSTEVIYRTPNLSGTALTSISSMSNLILYFRNERKQVQNVKTKVVSIQENRVIKTLPTTRYLAKCHEVKGRILPETIPLNYDIFMEHFNVLVS